MPRFLGGHPNANGGLDMAVRRAAGASMRAIQLFTAPPQYYGDRSSIRAERVARFREALAGTAIPPGMVQVHAAYVLNVATQDAAKWSRAAGGLRKEMERSVTLGAAGVCFHPGSATDETDAAAERVARAMTEALEAVPGTTRLLVENTAGAGHTFGRTPAELAAVLSRIPAPVRARAGYGLDTCHLFASGYDIAGSAEALARVLDDFEQACGEPPAFLHLNDSTGELGSNRDRHALIGEGQIGAEPFRWLLHDRRSEDIPLLLETPHQRGDVPDDDASADPWDVRMIELLTGMLPA